MLVSGQRAPLAGLLQSPASFDRVRVWTSYGHRATIALVLGRAVLRCDLTTLFVRYSGLLGTIRHLLLPV